MGSLCPWGGLIPPALPAKNITISKASFFPDRSQLLYADGLNAIAMSRTVEDIKRSIKSGKATVLTQQEISEMVEEKGEIGLKDVDVVTTAGR